MLRTRGEDEGRRFENAITLEVVGIKTSGEAVCEGEKTTLRLRGKNICAAPI